MRFGLVGTGPWAEIAHGPGLLAAEGQELRGVWGRRFDRAQEVAGALGVAAYDDLGALLDDVDAVAFAVPPDVQATLALRAARAGKHLLLDKPVATTADAARELRHGGRRERRPVGRVLHGPLRARFATVVRRGGSGGRMARWHRAVARRPRRSGQRVRRVGLAARPGCALGPRPPRAGVVHVPARPVTRVHAVAGLPTSCTSSSCTTAAPPAPCRSRSSPHRPQEEWR